MQTGKINVQTENIFPVIKKFLYSDHDIFLRELISNAVDATQKLRTLVRLGKSTVKLDNDTIEVIVNKEEKTLRVIDKGIGMSAEEVQKYITQIAFSSAEEFLEKYKGTDSANIIGHFGLGFYSAFMVSDRVEIFTKSHIEGTPAVHWSCDGSPDYEMEECEKEGHGTEIILHITDEEAEFLEENRILELLKKYCRFLPVPIQCGNEKHWEKQEGEENEIEVEKPRIINNTNPLWKQSPSNLKQEDYVAFYRELYPMTFEEPLFQIHLNVDYPFNLTGILYFPKVKNQLEIQKNKVQLYCNQVFITDQLEGIIPEFMQLLHGVIDSPDIPLNVSRSFLQSDGAVKKISAHISKKVSDKLEEMFKNDREDFEKKWEDIKIFIQYGSITDEKFWERAKNFYLLKNIEGKYFTLDEYKQHIETLQTDKNETLIYLYAADAAMQHIYIEAAKERGYDVLLMDSILDTHFINMLEQKTEKTKFSRVDADVIDKIIEKEDSLISKLTEDERKTLKETFEKSIENSKFTVIIESLSDTDLPVMIMQNEFMRRFQDMEKISGKNGMYGQFEHFNLVVNDNNEVITSLLKETDEDKKNQLTQQLIDLALLSQNMLKGEKLSQFVKRSLGFITK